MSYNNGPRIVTNGLVMLLDAGNSKSYSGSGTTWSDLSTRNNNASLINGPTYNSSNGGSIVVDGTNDYIDTGNSSSLNILNSLSINCWIYFLSLPNSAGNPSIVDKWDWPNNKRSFVLGTEGGVLTTYVSYDGTFNNRITCPDVAPSLNQWINLTMTYDNQTLRLYKNSTFITSSSYNQTRNIFNNELTSIWLMRSRGTDGSSRFLNARLSSVSIYNRAITASEILQNYNALKGRFNL